MRTRAGMFDALCAGLALLLGCSATSGTPPAASAASSSGAETLASAPLTPEQIFKRYSDCWGHFNAKNWDAFSLCYAPNPTSVWFDSGMPAATTRADIIEKQAKPFAAAFPDVTGTLQLTLANSNTVLGLAIMRGTHEGPLQTPMGAIPPTHKQIGILVGHMVTFDAAGQVTHESFVQDMGTMLAQLGLSPAPARPASVQDWAERPNVPATGGDVERANLERTKQLYELFNAHDPKFVDMLAPDVTDHNQSLPSDLVGPAAVGQLLNGFFTAFSDVRGRDITSWAAGDYVVAAYHFVGTNDGPMPAFGIATPTHKTFDVQMLEVTHWRDGKVQAIWPLFNGAALGAQLGLAPPPAAKK